MTNKLDELTQIKNMLSAYLNDSMPHIASDLGLRRYIKKADQIKAMMKSGKILDWGSGLGQMTYLLTRRGFEVTSLDLTAANSPFYSKINQRLIVPADPIKLPFPDQSFDAVLSCGVLEHVANDRESLKEIHRVLKTDGFFFIYMLPNKFSYIEHLSDLLKRSDHPIRYSTSDIRQLLISAGFNVKSVRYRGFLPYNLKGFPNKIVQLYHSLDVVNEFLDEFLAAIPGINLLSTNIEVIAKKKS
ncbi:MAG: class I SAM-dependent methyltransferase [Candidatus Margulisiibacteriota bacterium]